MANPNTGSAIGPHGPADLDFFSWPTPNGRKVAIFLEEAEIAYNLVPVDTTKGDQFSPSYLALNPNNKIPTIVDFRNGQPWTVFESGAILLHLAEREGRFLPSDPRRRSECIQWLMWQKGGFGPMLGQAHHFNYYAPEKLPYAVERYSNEAERLYRVLDRRLDGREFVVDDYTIVDMAIWPWITPRKLQNIDLVEFPNVAAWNDRIKNRPGVRRGFDVLAEASTKKKPSGAEWEQLFGRQQYDKR
jgi:GSH-dependent disulfide-bond oxidoreductase